MAVRNKASMAVGVVGSILLIISGFSAITYLSKIREFVARYLHNETIEFLFLLLIFFAGFGGILVLIGSILIGCEKVRSGRILITIGICIGPVGVFIMLLLLASELAADTTAYSITGILGIALAITAKYLAKPL